LKFFPCQLSLLKAGAALIFVLPNLCGPVHSALVGSSHIAPFAQAPTLWTRGSNSSNQIVERKLTFTRINAQEVSRTLHVIVNVQKLFFDRTQKTITVRTSSKEADLAEWLAGELDAPNPGFGGHEYFLPDNDEDAVLVWRDVTVGATGARPTHSANPQDFQELVNAIQALGETQQVVSYPAAGALVMRGRSWQASLATWLLGAIAYPQVANFEEPNSNRLKMPSESDAAELRIFSFPETSVQSLVRKANLIRKGARLSRVISLPLSHAIAIRGSDREVADAERIVERLRR